jgi:predicted TPR repeat methyltransferase
VLEINPKYVVAYFNKAIFLEGAGRTREAVDAYKEFVQRAGPEHASYVEAARGKISELEARR